MRATIAGSAFEDARERWVEGEHVFLENAHGPWQLHIVERVVDVQRRRACKLGV